MGSGSLEEGVTLGFEGLETSRPQARAWLRHWPCIRCGGPIITMRWRRQRIITH